MQDCCRELLKGVKTVKEKLGIVGCVTCFTKWEKKEGEWIKTEVRFGSTVPASEHHGGNPT